jgi:hypothetical protein
MTFEKGTFSPSFPFAKSSRSPAQAHAGGKFIKAISNYPRLELHFTVSFRTQQPLTKKCH